MDRPSFVLLGAAGGIGSATARLLAGRGAGLVLGGRNLGSLESLAAEVGGIALRSDARRREDVAAALERARSAYGRVDGVANLAGSLLLKPAHVITEAEWEETLATNLGTAFATVAAAAKALRATGGSVVLVSSAAAEIGIPNHEAIAAAKAGVVGLTRSAAATYAPRGIRVNAVAPGLVRTDLTARLTASEAAETASVSMHAIGRLGDPEDVASAIAWLLDPANSWVTGQVIGVDGGLASLRTRA